jgi:hypothetical protein
VGRPVPSAVGHQFSREPVHGGLEPLLDAVGGDDEAGSDDRARGAPLQRAGQDGAGQLGAGVGEQRLAERGAVHRHATSRP